MKIEQKIKDAILQNNLVIFAGSGLSSNFNLPSWNKLVEEVINEIDKKEFDTLIPVLNMGVMQPINALELIKSEHTIIKSYIKENFNVAPSNNFDLHKKIIELTEQVITTNYDNAFECAANNSISPSIYTDQFNISEIGKNNKPYIFKLHGSYNEPSNCIIFEDDYEKLYNSNNGAIEKLKTIFSEKTLLFLGFSFNDPDINLIFNSLDKAFGNNNKHFIITKEPNKFEKFNFLKTIAITEYNEINTYIEDCLKYKIQEKNNSIIANKEIIVNKSIQKIAILSPNPIDLKIGNEINQVINNFNSLDSTIYTGYLNIKTLLSLEDIDIIIIISKSYKSNIYIEEDNLQSKLVSVNEICENIPNDKIPIVFITDGIINQNISNPSIFIYSFKNSIIKKFIYKTLRNLDLNYQENEIMINLDKLEFQAFKNGYATFKSIYGNDRDLDIGKKSLTSVVGRVEEQSIIVTRLINIIKSNKLLNVKASGGTGKTTLIKKCAYELYNRGYYTAGVNFKSCENIKDFEGLEEILIEGFNLHNIIEFKEYLIQNYSQNKLDLLIILDNFETVKNSLTNDELNKVNELLRFVTDYASIVITSRETINKNEDFEDVYSLTPLITDDALILFQENYGLIKNEEEIKILRFEILEDLLNNNPLAIKLVTNSRTKFKHLSELKAQLKSHFFESTNEDFTTVFKDNADLNIERTRSIYQSINYSYCTLSDKEKIAFQLLSLFPDGISLSNFKKCFNKSTSKISISDKDLRTLRDKSLVEDYNGTLQLQPIIRRFSNFKFSKISQEKKEKFCLDAYNYNCFILELIEFVEKKKTKSESLRLSSFFKNNLLNVLSYIPDIAIDKDSSGIEKKYLLNFIYAVGDQFISKKEVTEYLNRLYQVREYFSDIPNADILIKVLALYTEYFHFEFDNSYEKLSNLLTVSEMGNRIFEKEDYTEQRYKSIISSIHSMEGHTLTRIESFIKNDNFIKYFSDADFFYLGIPENIARKKDGFYYFEYELMHNNCDSEKLKKYIDSLYMDEHLEIMQSTYTLSKIEKLDKTTIDKLVVTNPYTKGLKELMLAFNSNNDEKKKDYFKKALKNLCHIKYYYLEALYYYSLFLKEYDEIEFIEKKKEGLAKSKQFHYQYIYHLFNTMENKIEYDFVYSFYSIEGLEEYVFKHNEYWKSKFEKEM
ncbi:SIR2 family protein [Myroides sp. C4067]|uniref:SIR2 family protein n=1 Tax=Myroides sp. C4067 TaxID=3136765 RepID=UPI003101856C